MGRLGSGVALGMLALSACGDGGDGDGDGEPATARRDGGAPPVPDAAVEAGVAPAPAAPTLTELVDTVFQPSCVLGRCHITQAPAGGLSFTGTRISPHDALVNTPSSAAPGRVLVVPFDPEASYLMEKLTSDTPTAGTPMPPFAPLPDTSLTRIRAWITAGARDD